tara:strand:- start:162 stop:335 length:174 start_codon:yes stop_codon:yes gene_type:complete
METVEQFLSQFNVMRKDLEDDPDDDEWVVLHHAFCFISYHISEFKDYWAEVKAKEED